MKSLHSSFLRTIEFLFKLQGVFFLIMLSVSAVAQGIEDNILYSPPSPNAYGLVQSNIPVNQHTGAPVINLPITELKGRSLSVPVTLSYHSGGIKVQDVATWVGLGWSLNAGGVITRLVRGLPDEQANGYCGTNNIGEKASQALTTAYVQNVSNGSWDGEPDIFYFNFLGNKGSFVLSESGVPVFLPHSNLKLTPAICGSDNKWVMTDASGVTYTFGGDDSSRETTSSKISSSSTTQNYISSWYLSKIKAPTGDEINLSYVSGNAVSYKYFTQTNVTIIAQISFLNPSVSCNTTATGTTSAKDIEITIQNPRYLNTISSALGTITFNSVEGRADGLGRYLNSISTADYSGSFVEQYKFSYDYFTSDGCSAVLCKRLKLNKVSRAGSAIDLFSFQYDATNLPSRDSHAIDHWGFYNSNTAETKVAAVTDTGSPCGRFHAGADKSADTVRSKANVLTKIFEAAGGYTEFVYAAHKYNDASGNDQFAGGVRIRILKECTNASICRETYYYYKNFNDNTKSSGVIGGLPQYHFRVFNLTSPPPYPASNHTLVRHSQSLTDLFANGAHVTYTHVLERTPGNGFTRSYFTNSLAAHVVVGGVHPGGSDDHCDILADQNSCTVSHSGSLTVGSSISSMTFPYPPKSSKSPERGILSDREIFSESGKLLRAEKYEVEFTASTVGTVYGFKSAKVSFDIVANTGYRTGKYYLQSKPYMLKKSTTTLYDQTTSSTDISSKSATVTEYSYDMLALLPERVTTYNTNYTSAKRITVNRYVTHSGYTTNQIITDEARAVRLMYLRHQWSQPVETQTLMETGGQQYILNASVTSYQLLKPNVSVENTWFAVPKALFAGSSGVLLSQYTPSNVSSGGTFYIDFSNLRNVGTFDSYDISNANLLSFKRSDGVPTTVTWAYNNNYPQYVISNSNNTSPGSPDWQHRSYYEYKPLVGPTRAMDANDINLYYEYNDNNVLLLERNHNTHITKRYRSHVASAPYDASFTISNNLKLPGVSQIFKVENTEGVGNTKYTWDFGNGTVVEGSSAQVSHSYNNPGVYTVKLAKANPEYGSVVATQQVTIYETPTVSLTGDCSIIDWCTYTYQPCTITANVSEGCPGPMNIQWSYRNVNGSWYSYGSGSQVQFVASGEGTFEFKCVITDSCGRTSESNTAAIYVYKSNPNCATN